MGVTTLNLPAPVGIGPGPAVDVSILAAQKSLLVGGGFRGVVHVEMTNEAVPTEPGWIQVATFTSAGEQSLLAVARFMRIRVVSGFPNAGVSAEQVSSSYLALPATAGAGTGASVDTSALGNLRTVTIGASFGGVLIVEASEDGVDWIQVLAAVGRAARTVLLSAPRMRTRRVIPPGTVPGDTPIVNVGSSQADLVADELFIERQPFATRRIYARTTGSDITGDGTLTNPYATFGRAMADVPRDYDGVDYVVDITGLTDTFPDQYIMPRIVAAGRVTFDFTPGLIFPWRAPFRVEADPTLIQSITPTSQTTDPVDGLVTINDLTQAWVIDQYKGFIAVGSGVLEIGVIASNTATALEVTSTSIFTAPVRIMQLSATLQITDAGNPRAALSLVPDTDMIFAGVQFRHANPTANAYSIEARGGAAAAVRFYLCGFQGMSLEQRSIFAEGCYFMDTSGSTKDILQEASAESFSWCFLENQTFQAYGDGGDGGNGYFACIVDDCNPIGHNSFSANNEPEITYQIDNLRIRDAKNDGVQFEGGNRCSVRNSTINTSVGDAVQATGPGMLELRNVQGAGNGGFGCRVQRGAHVRRQTATAVTGTSGDLKVGGRAASLWTATPTNDVVIRATGTLTVTAQPANDETVTIGYKVYTFKTVLTGAANEILRGASQTAALNNLVAAINGAAGAGATYGTGTTPHGQVTAIRIGSTVVVTAVALTAAANSIETTETLALGSWGAATLSGGEDVASQGCYVDV